MPPETNVTLCRNKETTVDPLPCCKQSVEEQRCWMITSKSVRMATDVLEDTETESSESLPQEEKMKM